MVFFSNRCKLASIFFLCFVCYSSSGASSVTGSEQIERELKRGQDNQSFRKEHSHIGKRPKKSLSSKRNLLVNELSCWSISNISLSNDSDIRFKRQLQYILNSFDLSFYRAETGYDVSVYNSPSQPLCLGVQSIQKMTKAFQNKLIDTGYTTTRVFTPQQNLTSGKLTFTVVSGKLGKIKYNPVALDGKLEGQPKPTLWNVFPSDHGYLNLHLLEQGVDNLSRLGTVTTSMGIEPSAQRNASDVIVSWRQRKIPVRGSLSFDDAGSQSIGKYQGTASFYWDNPLRLNDIFNVSHTRSLLHRNDIRDLFGSNHRTKSETYAFSYSFPYKKWLFDLSSSRYTYTQAVQGFSRVIDYSGDSRNDKIKLSRLLYRNANHRAGLILGVWARQSKSYINRAEINVQRRRNTGYMLGYTHTANYDFSSISLEILYKKGWRHWGTIRAPEEKFDEGTSLMDFITLNLNLNKRILLGDVPVSLNTNLNYQQNATRLLSQDKFSVGGRNSVRGFAKNSLTGDRGFYLRNDATFSYSPKHSYYFGLDFGSVSGKSAKIYSDRHIAGVVAGLKGRFFNKTPLSYEFYISMPLRRPDFFEREGFPTGFNVSYNF